MTAAARSLGGARSFGRSDGGVISIGTGFDVVGCGRWCDEHLLAAIATISSAVGVECLQRRSRCRCSVAAPANLLLSDGNGARHGVDSIVDAYYADAVAFFAQFLKKMRAQIAKMTLEEQGWERGRCRRCNNRRQSAELKLRPAPAAARGRELRHSHQKKQCTIFSFCT